MTVVTVEQTQEGSSLIQDFQAEATQLQAVDVGIVQGLEALINQNGFREIPGLPSDGEVMVRVDRAPVVGSAGQYVELCVTGIYSGRLDSLGMHHVPSSVIFLIDTSQRRIVQWGKLDDLENETLRVVPVAQVIADLSAYRMNWTSEVQGKFQFEGGEMDLAVDDELYDLIESMT